MRNLSKFLENPFDDDGISIAELVAFTTDNIERMKANNSSGELTPRITPTELSLGLVRQRFTADETKLGLRKGSKQDKNAFRKDLPATMAKLALVVEVKYGEKSPEYLECLPHGRSVFTSSTDDLLESHIQTFITGVTAHQADLGAQVVTDATAVKTGWLEVYAPSESASAAKAATKDEKKYARENLQAMLYLNLIKFCEMHPREPEKLATYMTQSLLEDHPRSSGEEPAPSPTPTPSP